MCILLPPEVVYKKTRDVLRDLHGQEQVVARLLIDGSLMGLKSVPEYPDALTKLSLKCSASKLLSQE